MNDSYIIFKNNDSDHYVKFNSWYELSTFIRNGLEFNCNFVNDSFIKIKNMTEFSTYKFESMKTSNHYLTTIIYRDIDNNDERLLFKIKDNKETNQSKDNTETNQSKDNKETKKSKDNTETNQSKDNKETNQSKDNKKINKSKDNTETNQSKVISSYFGFINNKNYINKKFESFDKLSKYINDTKFGASHKINITSYNIRDNIENSIIKKITTLKNSIEITTYYHFEELIIQNDRMIVIYANENSNEQKLEFIVNDDIRNQFTVNDDYNYHSKKLVEDQEKTTQARYTLINGENIIFLKDNCKLKEYLSSNKDKYNYKKLKIVDNFNQQIYEFNKEFSIFSSLKKNLPRNITNCMKSKFKMLYIYANDKDKPLDLRYNTFFELMLFADDVDQINNYRRSILDENHKHFKNYLIAGIYVIKDNNIVSKIDKTGQLTINGDYRLKINTGTHFELLENMKNFDKVLNDIEDFYPYFEEYSKSNIISNGRKLTSSITNIFELYFDMNLSNKDMIEIVKKHIELDAIISLKN